MEVKKDFHNTGAVLSLFIDGCPWKKSSTAIRQGTAMESNKPW